MSEATGTHASSSELQIKKASEKPPAGSLIMSGIRATDRLHIGNYFGALKQWVDLQRDYRGFYGVMDWHGLTTHYKDTKSVSAFARDIFAECIAWGLDPQRNTIFIQSLVPEHIELTTLFMMITPMSWLERVPTWKDAEEEAKANETHNLGRFMYPVLQSADIAIYRGTHVPIGQDQIPHLELSRDIIRRFNFLYGGNLPEPKPIFSDTPLLIGSDGRKMSKSYNNAFALLQEEDELSKTLRAMPTDPARVRRTDPGEPTKCPIYSFHKLYSPAADLKWVEEGCRTAGIGCGDCKKKLGENVNAHMAGPRAIKKELMGTPGRLDELIHEGSAKARKEASIQMDQVRSWTGFTPG